MAGLLLVMAAVLYGKLTPLGVQLGFTALTTRSFLTAFLVPAVVAASAATFTKPFEIKKLTDGAGLIARHKHEQWRLT